MVGAIPDCSVHRPSSSLGVDFKRSESLRIQIKMECRVRSPASCWQILILHHVRADHIDWYGSKQNAGSIIDYNGPQLLQPSLSQHRSSEIQSRITLQL